MQAEGQGKSAERQTKAASSLRTETNFSHRPSLHGGSSTEQLDVMIMQKDIYHSRILCI